MQATLRISNPRSNMGDSPALTVATYLAASMISANITEGYSSVDRQVEVSLAVELFDIDGPKLNIIFRWLRDRFGLGCAWLDAGEYSGCIKKWDHFSG